MLPLMAPMVGAMSPMNSMMMMMPPPPPMIHPKPEPAEPVAGPAPPQVAKEELAYLPFFEDELQATASRDPTDILVVDFDRTLLATPSLSRDLLTKQARTMLETKLEWGRGWWQSPDVLQAALELGVWDEALLALVREAVSQPDVLLVLTTARTTESLPTIRAALADRGVARIDHVSCLTPDAGRTGTDEQAAGKGALLELLLETYDTLERVYVVDGNAKNAAKYTKTSTRFVHEGWLNPEAFYLVNRAASTATLPLARERQLIQGLLSKSTLPVEAHVLVQAAVRRVALPSRKQLASLVASMLPETVPDTVLCESVELPLTPNTPVPAGRVETWAPRDLMISGRHARLRLQSLQDPAVQIQLPAARIKPAPDQTLVVETDMVVHTYVYEPRRLDVLINPVGSAASPSRT